MTNTNSLREIERILDKNSCWVTDKLGQKCVEELLTYFNQHTQEARQQENTVARSIISRKTPKQAYRQLEKRWQELQALTQTKEGK